MAGAVDENSGRRGGCAVVDTVGIGCCIVDGVVGGGCTGRVGGRIWVTRTIKGGLIGRAELEAKDAVGTVGMMSGRVGGTDSPGGRVGRVSPLGGRVRRGCSPGGRFGRESSPGGRVGWESSPGGRVGRESSPGGRVGGVDWRMLTGILDGIT